MSMVGSMLTSPEYVNCDLCGADDYEVIRQETLRRPLHDSDFSVFGEQSEHPQIVRCRVCRLVYANPRDSGAALRAKYEDIDLAGYLLEEASRRRTHFADVALMRRYISRGRVLDVGCSAGLFLSCLPEGFEPYGVEPGAQAVRHSRKLLGELAVQHGTLETSSFRERFFDAVTMWDVIEHFTSPRQSLSIVAQILRPGGVLFVVTPDFGSPMGRLMGRRWPHLIRQHLYYFDLRSIRNLLESCGFEPVYQSTYTRYFTLRYVAQRIKLLRPPKAAEAGTSKVRKSWIGGISIPINLGDSLLIVSRRTDAT